MNKALKIGLIAVAGIMVVCFGGAYVLWSKYGAPMAEAGKVALAEGETFAANADNNGCVVEFERRFVSDTSKMGAITNSAFLHSCLAKSKPAPGFCDGVPSHDDRAATETWTKARCPGIDERNPDKCFFSSATVQVYCNRNSKAA